MLISRIERSQVSFARAKSINFVDLVTRWLLLALADAEFCNVATFSQALIRNIDKVIGIFYMCLYTFHVKNVKKSCPILHQIKIAQIEIYTCKFYLNLFVLSISFVFIFKLMQKTQNMIWSIFPTKRNLRKYISINEFIFHYHILSISHCIKANIFKLISRTWKIRLQLLDFKRERSNFY
jgi:hypothetical protein